MNIEDVWYSDTSGSRAVRALLAPPSWLYRAAVKVRNSLYDRAGRGAVTSTIPVVSVGNLTVGGTGKTPFTAFLVRELLTAGHTPAVVMRGYGGDEPLLHKRLNPSVNVYTGADRLQGIARAESEGADVIVMDDAFQHRAAKRDLDIVLVSADRWRERLGMLPSGPLREPLESLSRADMVVVTRKNADIAAPANLIESIVRVIGPATRVAEALIEPVELTAFSGLATRPLEVLHGSPVLAIAGVGDPSSFFGQLRARGAIVTAKRFPDHHAYSDADAAKLARESAGHKYVITTEKDAIKLAPAWPVNAPELWYLSQAVALKRGSASVAAALADLFVKRATSIVG